MLKSLVIYLYVSLLSVGLLLPHALAEESVSDPADSISIEDPDDSTSNEDPEMEDAEIDDVVEIKGFKHITRANISDHGPATLVLHGFDRAL